MFLDYPFDNNHFHVYFHNLEVWSLLSFHNIIVIIDFLDLLLCSLFIHFLSSVIGICRLFIILLCRLLILGSLLCFIYCSWRPYWFWHITSYILRCPIHNLLYPLHYTNTYLLDVLITTNRIPIYIFESSSLTIPTLNIMYFSFQ